MMDPYYRSRALLVFGGSKVGDINVIGPKPEAINGVPYFHEKATESVQYPETRDKDNNLIDNPGKQGQANRVTSNYIHRIGDLGLQVVGYSAGADASLIYAHDYMQAQNKHTDRAQITAVALLGPTMTGKMSNGDLKNEWYTIMDELLWQGVDICLPWFLKVLMTGFGMQSIRI